MIKRTASIVFILVVVTALSSNATPVLKGKLLPPFKCIFEIKPDYGNGECGLEGILFYFTTGKSYGAYNTNTGKLAWIMQFKEKHGSVSAVSNGKILFITTDQKRLLACRLKDGKTLWNIEFKTNNRLIPIENLVLCEFNSGTLTAFNADDFNPVWKCKLDSQPSRKSMAAKAGDLYPYTVGNDLLGINLKDGSILYRIGLGFCPGKPVRLGNRIYISGRSADENDTTSNRLWSLNASTGKRVWGYKFEGIAALHPVVMDDLVIFTSSKNRLSALNRFSGKIAWSKDIYIPYYSIPTANNHQLILNAGESIYLFDCKGNPVFRFDTDNYVLDHSKTSIIPNGFITYASSNAKCYVMGEDEPAAEEIPELINKAQKYDRTSAEELAKSHDPRAVDFLISQLNNPNAFISVRKTAYRSMARSGEESSINAVLAARDTSRTIVPLKQRLVIDDTTGGDWIGKYSKDKKSACLLAAQKDSSGTLWGLMQMEIVGNRFDLWIARFTDNKWQDFIFTGDTEEKPDLSNWFAKYVGNKSIELDTDDDGLTDLIEQRWGTSLDNTDSDGDGLADSIDKNPLTAPRELNDTEQLLATAFEGYFNKGNEDRSPVVVDFPEGIQPFELFGYDGAILPKSRVQDKPIYKSIGEGTVSAHFNTPSGDLYGTRINNKTREVRIQWNDDHTEAVVGLTFFVANLSAEGCDIRLRKINGTWFVIQVKSLWVA